MRNIIKSIILLSVTLVISANSFGQNKIDPTLEVKRDFDVKLQDVTKSKLNTYIADSLKSFNLNIQYSIFNKPYKDLYEFSPLPSAQIEKPGKQQYPFLYTDLGFNFPTNPHLKIMLSPRLSGNFSLLLFADHDSYLSDLKLMKEDGEKTSMSETKIAGQSMKNKLGAKFGIHWKKGEFLFDFGYKRDFFTYYGMNDGVYPDGVTPEKIKDFRFMRDSLSHQYDNVFSELRIRSVNPDPNSFYYDVSAKISTLNDKPSLMKAIYRDPFKENLLNISAVVGPDFAFHHKFYVGLSFTAANTIGKNEMDRGNIEVYPHYKLNYKILDLEAGIKINHSYSPDKKSTDFYVKTLATVELVQKNLWVYAKLDGGNEFRTYHELIALNPYLAPDIDIKNTNVPLSAQFGLKGQYKDRFAAHIYALYTNYKDNYFFYNTPIGFNSLMRVDYVDQNRFTAGAELSFKSEDIQSGINIKYHNYNQPNTQMPAYNKSPFEINGFARYNWRERIVFSADLLHRAKSPALFVNSLPGTATYVGAFTKIDLEALYSYDKNLSFYVRANNILNSKEQYFLYYRQMGMNFGVGVTLKF